LESFVFNYSATDTWNALISASAQILAIPGKSASAAYDRSIVLGAQSAVSTVQAIAAAEPVADYPTPANYLDSQLREIARLILGGAGARGYCAVYGSFDTHSAQNQSQPQLLADVGTAMQNFYLYLRAHNASSNVVIVTMSDFGRRPGANLDFGTDHGAASVSFVLGDPVAGGVYGTYPDLTQLDVNGNLAVTVDFRNLLSDVIQYMGGNPTPILGETYPKLGFI
ncbi:MAG TPA: DUF1501 domain-containing protein, partial [Stellaceae bacterium]|nr:DUF1501 domain-containing protein [Stellaceae bacterium]